MDGPQHFDLELDILNFNSNHFEFLESNDWLCEVPKSTITPEDDWTSDVFDRPELTVVKYSLLKKLAELSVSSPRVIDKRTFTRQKKAAKRESIFNLSTIYAPDDEDIKECAEVPYRLANSTCLLEQPYLNNSRLESNNYYEDDLTNMIMPEPRRNFMSPQRSPASRSPVRMYNTITKKRSSLSQTKTAYALVDMTFDYDDYEDDEEEFLNVPYLLSSRGFQTNNPNSRQIRTVRYKPENLNSVKIMPNVSNLSNHGKYQVGRSMPNISRNKQNTPKLRIPENSRLRQNKVIRPLNSQSQYKAPSDLSMNGSKNGFRTGQLQDNRLSLNYQPHVTRVMGDSSRLSQANLSRNSTFRVRANAYRSNSDENVLEDCHFNSINCDSNITCNVTNGFNCTLTNDNQLNQTSEQHSSMSKIPGPKTNRSAIPVSGECTALPIPSKQLHKDNWKSGCF